MPKPATAAFPACSIRAVPPPAAAEETGRVGSGQLHGRLAEQGLTPGIHTLQAVIAGPSQAPQAVRRRVIACPAPFDWPSSGPR